MLRFTKFIPTRNETGRTLNVFGESLWRPISDQMFIPVVLSLIPELKSVFTFLDTWGYAS